MTPYELGSFIVAIVAVVLSVLIPFAQFLYRRFRKPKLDLIPFDGPSLILCFNESGSYTEFMFSILCENAGSLVRTIGFSAKNLNTGQRFQHTWTSIKPIHTNWMNAGTQQAVLNTATYVHPIKIEEGKAEPLNIEFCVDVDPRFDDLLRERNELLLSLCREESTVEGILLHPSMQNLIGRIRDACLWKAGEYSVELKVTYDAAGICSKHFRFSLSESDASKLVDNALGIATWRIPAAISGSRFPIQPLRIPVSSE